MYILVACVLTLLFFISCFVTAFALSPAFAHTCQSYYTFIRHICDQRLVPGGNWMKALYTIVHKETAKHVVSFSLYGNRRKFIYGALTRAREIKTFGEKWRARFYVD